MVLKNKKYRSGRCRATRLSRSGERSKSHIVNLLQRNHHIVMTNGIESHKMELRERLGITRAIAYCFSINNIA